MSKEPSHLCTQCAPNQFFPHSTNSTTRALAFKQINILMTTIHIGELDIQGQTSKRQTIAGELQWP
jgi:hypothetical protein